MKENGIPKYIEVTSLPLDPGAIGESVGDPGGGSVVVFVGTVRNQSPGKPGVTHLEYEAYPGQVEIKLGEIADEAAQRWPILSLAVVHRIGDVRVGEPSVVVAVSTPHRGDGFAAAQYVIDELKARAPIWKKEHWEGGAAWSEGA